MAKPNKLTSYSDKLIHALQSNHEATMGKLRQSMHDKLPARAEGHIGQKVVDAFSDVEISRSLVDFKFFIKFIFKDPDGNKWTLEREFSYLIDKENMENAEHYLWDQALALHEEEFAQLALVLT
jgi:hypothetical protein